MIIFQDQLEILREYLLAIDIAKRKLVSSLKQYNKYNLGYLRMLLTACSRITSLV